MAETHVVLKIFAQHDMITLASRTGSGNNQLANQRSEQQPPFDRDAGSSSRSSVHECNFTRPSWRVD
jgi:hypothetical protein